METISDVIIVGGGPCGSFAAFNLAKRGINVAVFEEHSEIGVPCHCTGHLSIEGLKRLGLYPLPTEVVENVFYGAVFHSPNGRTFQVRFSQPVTCVVNRAFFDKHLAEKAEQKGAHFFLNSHVESLIVEEDFARGVRVNGKHEERFAKIVIDAEGISSRILRMMGLASLNREMLVKGIQAEVENVKNVEPDTVEIFLGNAYAPGFYAWLAPKKDGKAKVGLATNTGNPRDFLKRLMLKHPTASKKLQNAKILQATLHPITLGGPIPKTYSNGFLVVGDAASQVKPTTGGGVIFGMTCAKFAAEVAYEALCQNDFSANFLSAYQKRFERSLGFDVEVMLKIRKMLNAMSDAKIDSFINFCNKLKLSETLEGIKEIDFQGQTFMQLLGKPKMLTAILYFFLIYLSANP